MLGEGLGGGGRSYEYCSVHLYVQVLNRNFIPKLDMFFGFGGRGGEVGEGVSSEQCADQAL